MKNLLLSALLVSTCLRVPVQADVFKMSAGLKSLETVVVDNPGNPADDTGLGTVAYPFMMGKYEVTAAQYAEFLNIKAKSDRSGLYHPHMSETGHIGCKITRSGTEGSYTYSVAPEYANRPVNWVSFVNACRFCNWLHHGQGDGDTETGAYTLNDVPGIKRNPGAKWFLPSEDEWYKAAYHDPAKPGGAGYWNYPTRSDSKPGRDFESSNGANCYEGGYLDPVRYLTEVGAFGRSQSGYGTFDQGGNVFEWTEAIVPPSFRRFRGGSFGNDGGWNVVDASLPPKGSQFAGDIVGFRVASANNSPPGIPEKAGAPAPVVEASSTTPGADPFPRRPWRNPENNRPFFPMGWFEDHLWSSRPGPHGTLAFALANLDLMAGEGANMVLLVSAWSDLDDEAQLATNLTNMTAYLDHAHKRGIKVLPQLGGWYGAFMRNDDTEIARQRRWIQAISHHPALLGYQLYDEPEFRNGGMKEPDLKDNRAFAEGLVKLRAAIREWDRNTNHAVQVVFNVVPYEGQDISDWRLFLPAIDTFQVDRYPVGISSPFFAQGDWCALIMAWTMAHGTAGITNTAHLNPAPVMQGVGNANPSGWWRNPLYEETRYMACSSLTVGGWGALHWIFNSTSESIRRNVARLHAELRQLLPALESSYEKPPFTVSQNHAGITRSFIKDRVPDISTLALEDDSNYYLLACDNSGVFEDVSFRMRLPNIKDVKTREAFALNEGWSRDVTWDPSAGEWTMAAHTMCFGDVNIWVIPKAQP